MTNILYDLTGKIDKKTVTILSEINRVADRLGFAYFIENCRLEPLIQILTV